MNKIIPAKKLNKRAVPQHRSFRQLIKRMFASVLNCQGHGSREELHNTILQKLQDIEDVIEIVAREIARQANRNE